MKDLRALVSKHSRQGIVVDTNLLLLHFVGGFDPGRISSFKRTEIFSEADFQLLSKLLARFSRIVTTPTILAETSAFSGHFPHPDRSDYYSHFGQRIAVLDEQFVASRELAADEDWYPFGLTDCSLIRLASESYLVITTDLALWAHLETKGFDAINFNHYRLAYYEGIGG
jgi:hypothetical protein